MVPTKPGWIGLGLSTQN